MGEKLYGHYEGLMDYDTYPDHVMAMTVEELHGKSEIAAELAYRDQRIAELEAENTKLWHNLRDAMEWNWLDDDAPERFDLDGYSRQTKG